MLRRRGRCGGDRDGTGLGGPSQGTVGRRQQGLVAEERGRGGQPWAGCGQRRIGDSMAAAAAAVVAKGV